MFTFLLLACAPETSTELTELSVEAEPKAKFKLWFKDADGDLYGDKNKPKVAKLQPAGYVKNFKDCDDTDKAIKPGATELVGDEVDQNCDTKELCYVDWDDDGHSINSTVASTNVSCTDSGEATDADPMDDCDDGDPDVYFGAPEIVGNGIDDDCNGLVDDVLVTWYRDMDGDGYGDPNVSKQASSQPAGHVADNTDCDDTDASICPGAAEVWYNGIDDNCDNLSDYDQDGDGFDAWQYGGPDADDTDPNVI